MSSITDLINLQGNRFWLTLLNKKKMFFFILSFHCLDATFFNHHVQHCLLKHKDQSLCFNVSPSIEGNVRMSPTPFCFLVFFIRCMEVAVTDSRLKQHVWHK